MKTYRLQNRGIALFITLAFVVMVTIIIVGFAASMRTDRPAAHSYLEKKRASWYAQTGVDNVIAKLQLATNDTNRNWISQPGQLVIGASQDDPSTPKDDRKVLQPASVLPPIMLSSGLPTIPSSDPILQPPNLNIPTFRDPGTNLITDRPDTSDPSSKANMQVKWIYVRQDGSTDNKEEPVTNDSGNPIMGRYAYWTDDESCKVNYNIAWGRTASNTLPPSHPSKIALAALDTVTDSMADALHNFITTGTSYDPLNHGFFNTPADARQADSSFSGISAAIQKNKFEVTHYSHDPDTTFFNEDRIVLTTLASRAGGKPFLDVGITDPSKLDDPDNMDVSKVRTTVSKLVSYLKRSDWPMTSGSGSFQSKYYQNDETRLTHIAINIIDYVRSKECPIPLVIPSRGYIETDSSKTDFGLFTLTSNTTTLGAHAADTFLGLSRAPFITEMSVWHAKVSTGVYDRKLIFEFHLPANYGLSSIDLNDNYELYYQYWHYAGDSNPYVKFRFTNGPPSPMTGAFNPDSVLQAGKYVTYTVAERSSTSLPAPYPFGVTVGFRTALFHYASATATTYTKAVITPLVTSGTISDSIQFKTDPAGTAVGDIQSVELDDPRINSFKDDWHQSSHNTLGAKNSLSSVGKSASLVVPQPGPGEPQLDTDSAGNISDASLYMPPPAGQTFTRGDGTVDDNTLGMVTSVAELGYIHTGMKANKVGTPWRTLRLQPKTSDTSVVPDWALMDLFTVPCPVPATAASVFSPHSTAFGGRVNLNSKVKPFSMDRTLPLEAVLVGAHTGATGAATVPASNSGLPLSAHELATNIYNLILAQDGKLYGYQDGIVSPGEVVEIKGIADGGESSETLVREISNLVTNRGDVFSVYTVGQALKQTSGGKLLITGEQRMQAMIERYVDANGAVRFAPVYFRQLVP